MIKRAPIFFAFLFCLKSFATNYYVGPKGKDWHKGIKPHKPLKTIQKAMDKTLPGDTVFVMDGVYTEPAKSQSIISIHRSGTEKKWIVLKNYPGHKPVLKFKNWGAIQVFGASYIEINGFSVVGNSDNISLEYAKEQMNKLGNSKTCGNGIFVREDTINQNNPHHIRIINNSVSKAPGGGIGAMRCDYITIKNNVVSECAFYAPYANSGISIYQAIDIDEFKGYKILITNNISHSNYNYIPFYFSNKDPEKREFTDGNGIIVDDFKGSQDFVGKVKTEAYKGKTLIANNIVYNNGGSGIHAFKSTNVDIAYNTAYKNSRHPKMDVGQIFAIASGHIRIFNNIMYALPGKKINAEWKNTNVVYERNLYFDETDKPKIEIAGKSALIANPEFVNNSVVWPDFHLKENSPAIDFGSKTVDIQNDFEGNPRIFGKSPDLGAYEFFKE